MEIRVATPDEIAKIGDIDRTEEISQNYVIKDGALELEDFVVTAQSGLAGNIQEWRHYLDEGGALIGAFDESAMAAFVIYQPDLSPDMAQLAVLHVGRPYRRRGLGRTLSMKVIELARTEGKNQVYVSATPTRGTVEFYQSLGFQLTPTPDPELLALEPEDIHMVLNLLA